MTPSTHDLIRGIKEADDINSFFELHKNDFVTVLPHEYLNELIAIKNMTVSDVVKNSASGEYVYKIFKGERKASRDILISIAFGMELSLEETQLLLRISKFATLDPRDKRDGVIIYALTHSMTVFETDDLLDENNFTTLK